MIINTCERLNENDQDNEELYSFNSYFFIFSDKELAAAFSEDDEDSKDYE